jgi:hypothetical protein
MDTIDNNKLKKSSKQGAIMSAVGALMILAITGYSVVELNHKSDKNASLLALHNNDSLTIAILEEENFEVKKDIIGLFSTSVETASFDKQQIMVEERYLAHQTLRSQLDKYTPNREIIVEYYRKTKDDTLVVNALELIGYNFLEKVSQKGTRNEQTNAIWFGASVPTDDVRIIALALVRAGINIKGIRPFEKESSFNVNKRNTIEIGYAEDVKNQESYSIFRIENDKSFDR